MNRKRQVSKASTWLAIAAGCLLPRVGDGTFADEVATPTSKPQTTVAQLLQAEFKRVAGPAPGDSVLDVGPAGSWYDTYVWGPTVDFDGELYRMWFTGAEETSDPGVPYGWYERIGLATSRDGLKWQIANDGEPVLDLGPPGSADAKGLAHPYVLKVGDKFMMWYGAIDGTQAKDLGLKPANVRIERICLASSDDGIHWKRENGGKPVMDIGPKGSIDSIQATGMHVLHFDGKFVMWYGAYDGLHRLAIATSPDGVRWQKGNDGKALTGLQGTEQLGPSVYFDGRRYFMLYNRPLDGSWVTYSASSDDGIRWKPAHKGQPVLGPPPKGNFGSAGRGRNHSVHPTKMIVADGRVRIWYGAEDAVPPHHQRIGLMEALLSTPGSQPAPD